MPILSRRSFVLKSAAALSVGALTTRGLRPSTWAASAGANEAIRIGVIGLGGKGTQHMNILAKRADTRVVALCDLDPVALARAKKSFEGKQVVPFTTNDPRELLARADVDAVFVVTGNQWHALLAVWACQAGKDVYVEKPMTHTVWEGRKLIEAAAKYKRVVQVGTQYRSESGLAAGIKWLHEGRLGKLKYVHCLYLSRRGPIGKRTPWYPTDVNYDLFCGPTPVVPLERDKLHYDWHWMWHTGNGELGNNGVHLLDIARRIVRSEAPPRRVLGLGGRYVVDDCAETPNTQLAFYDYPEAPVIYEGRALPAKPDVNYSDAIHGTRVGVAAVCEGGYLAGLTGCAAYDPSGKVIEKFGGDGGGATHLNNFLSAVRSRRALDLAAPPEIGHGSAGLCHFGNISLRVGAPAAPAQIAKALESMPVAGELARNMQAHLGVHGVDLTKQKLALGPWMDLEPSGDGIVKLDSGDEAALARARYLLHEAQRPPFVIPEKV
ncbi:MAG: Gfo/Idh/MocA family oxidoreductase [Verrucomicrobia bacterium]|nr:Gfo/Idh/MocA family oxidoreductase [Verrucomicrobiota bacterium]